MSSRFHLDPVGWYRRSARTDFLSAVADAVWTEQRVSIRYESWKGAVSRDVDPLGLVLKAGDWYLVGRAGGKPRTYRVSNILALTLANETFKRPRDFDLATFWAESTLRFETEIYRGTAIVRVSPRGRKSLRSLSAALADAVDRAEGEPGSGEWTQITIPIESIEHGAEQMLRLGPEVEVLGPTALRERMIATVTQMAAIYSERRS